MEYTGIISAIVAGAFGSNERTYQRGTGLSPEQARVADERLEALRDAFSREEPGYRERQASSAEPRRQNCPRYQNSDLLQDML